MSRTRFTPDLELDGLSPDEAFSALGNDIRLEIIRVLWRANAAHVYDDGSDAVETMAYSRLKEEVGIDDNGKFNYHLSQLDPHFIRRTDDGYRLSGAGKRIARTVVAISGPDLIDFSEELDLDCPLCGGTVAATYEDQWLRIRCAECDGLFGDQAPTGTLFLTSFPAAGLTSRDPTQALGVGLYRCTLDVTYLMYGLCRECAGPISSSVSVCDAHDSREDNPCDSCGTPFPVWADMRCDTCGFAKRLPLEMFATGLVVATGAIDDLEMDIRSLSFEQSTDLLKNRVRTDVSRDPLQVSITIDTETGPVTVAMDGDMNVVDFDSSRRADGSPSRTEVDSVRQEK